MRGLRERFALELRVVVVVVPLLFKDNDADDDAEATMLGEANVEDEATAPTIILKPPPPPPLSIMLKRLLFKFSVSSSFTVVVAAAAIVGEEAVAVAAFKVFNFVTVNVERVERVTVAVVTPFFKLRLKFYYIFILKCTCYFN